MKALRRKSDKAWMSIGEYTISETDFPELHPDSFDFKNVPWIPRAAFDDYELVDVEVTVIEPEEPMEHILYGLQIKSELCGDNRWRGYVSADYYDGREHRTLTRFDGKVPYWEVPTDQLVASISRELTEILKQEP